jgi:hypothetical protein
VIPWQPFLVVAGISAAATTAIAALSASKGWTVHSPAWGALAVVAMWAPALGRFVAQRTVDRDFRATLPLHRWGATGAQVVLWPVVLPLAVYGAAYAIAGTSALHNGALAADAGRPARRSSSTSS